MICTRNNRGACEGFNRGLVAQTGFIPEGRRFLQDTFPFEVLKTEEVLTEDIGGKARPMMRITGLVQEADIKNANGRVYPVGILRTAIEEIQPDIERRAVVGEYDHPADAKIHLDRLSHVMTKVWMEGSKVYGEAEILDNQPHGAMLRGLFESKIRVGMSSRGVGDMEVKEDNGEETFYVVPGFSIVTWDCVAEPSVNGAYLQICENRLKPLNKVLKKEVKKGIISKTAAEQVLVEEIQSLFR